MNDRQLSRTITEWLVYSLPISKLGLLRKLSIREEEAE